MNSRERVLAILNRQSVDRIPVDLWYTPEVMADLKRHTGCGDELAVFGKLGLDKLVWIFPQYRRPASAENRNTWGVLLRGVQAGYAAYEEFADAPLAGIQSPAEVDAYEGWPKPELYDYELSAQQAKAAHEHFLTLGPWVSFFEVYCQLRGLEQSMMDLITEPELVNAILDRIERCQTQMMERMFARLGNTLDLVFVSDDMGSQASLLMSLEMWDQYLRPRLKRWCDFIHAHGKKVFYHSDGAVEPLIPRLIDCGIDILNPIQHVCPGMEMAGLKQKYGNQVIFHGGVENQKVLPFGSVQDVEQETRTCLQTLGAGREGYICCSCHNTQAGTPVDNILAMIRVVHESGSL